MKKFVLILLIVMFATPCFAEVFGKWFNPKQIITYIQPNHRYTVMMKHGFAEWTRLTNKRIIFRYSNSPNNADIKVFFVKKINTHNMKNLDRAIGLTNTRTTGKKILHADIYIADKTQDGRTLSRDEVYTVMLHEIGHAIGLNHSSDPKSVMYPGANVIQEISKADLNRLVKLYGWQ